MDRLQRIMLSHGMLVILAAMLAGFMLTFNLVGGFEVWPGVIIPIPTWGTTEGWVRAHTGGVTNGLMVMAVGLALPKIDLSDRMRKFTAWGFIYVAWSFTLFYWLGQASGNRGLTLGDNPLGEADLVGAIAFLPAIPSGFIVIILLLVGARGVLRSDGD